MKILLRKLFRPSDYSEFSDVQKLIYNHLYVEHFSGSHLTQTTIYDFKLYFLSRSHGFSTVSYRNEIPNEAVQYESSMDYLKYTLDVVIRSLSWDFSAIFTKEIVYCISYEKWLYLQRRHHELRQIQYEQAYNQVDFKGFSKIH